MKLKTILFIGLFVLIISVGIIKSHSGKVEVQLQNKYTGNEFGIYYDLDNPEKVYIKRYNETEFKEAEIINVP